MDRVRSALVVVAHTDDESLGCGATLAKLAAEGWAVDVVIMTDGLVTARGGAVQDNREACEKACAVLGLGAPVLLGYPDQQLDRFTVADLSNAVLALGHRPDLVITNAASDLNQDHRITAEVAKIVARPRDRPVSVLACEIPASTFWNGSTFAADYFVDVSDTFDLKAAAFACYDNEVQPAPSPRSIEGIELLARYHGMQAGTRVAEAFALVRGCSGTLP